MLRFRFFSRHRFFLSLPKMLPFLMIPKSRTWSEKTRQFHLGGFRDRGTTLYCFENAVYTYCKYEHLRRICRLAHVLSLTFMFHWQLGKSLFVLLWTSPSHSPSSLSREIQARSCPAVIITVIPLEWLSVSIKATHTGCQQVHFTMRVNPNSECHFQPNVPKSKKRIPKSTFLLKCCLRGEAGVLEVKGRFQ